MAAFGQGAQRVVANGLPLTNFEEVTASMGLWED